MKKILLLAVAVLLFSVQGFSQFGIKAGLKAPLHAILGGHYVADGIRYFLMTAFAGCVWPLTFPLFGKLGKK